MLGLLIPIIEKVSPILAKIISFESPLAGKVIGEIAHYFGSTADDPDLINKIQSDAESEKKLLDIELKYKDFEVNVKMENDNASS